jgi:hypothetical protein
MKMSDILRDLAELLDQHGQEQAPAEPKDFAQPEQDTDGTNPVMIPPLQQKLELLKKGVGVPSAFDQDGNGVPDELDAIRKNAGLNQAVVHIASDDEPLDV